MGTSQSVDKKRHKSRAKDVVPDLIWALTEMASWEERAMENHVMEKLLQNPEAYTEIASKYAYLNELLKELGEIGGVNCKLQLKTEELTRKLSRTKRPYETILAERRLQMKKEELSSGLADYDNLRGAVEWLKNSCELHFQGRQLDEAIVKKQREMEAKIDDKRLKPYEEKMMKVQNSIKQHSRALFAVALHYHDQNNSGAIEPTDMPEMSAHFFNICDVNNDHSIRPDELLKAVDRVDKMLQRKNQEIEKLEAQRQNLELALMDVKGRPQHEEQRTEFEMCQVRLLKNEIALDTAREQQDEIRRNREGIQYYFLGTGFVSDMTSRLQELQEQDMYQHLTDLLEAAQIKDERLYQFLEQRQEEHIGVVGAQPPAPAPREWQNKIVPPPSAAPHAQAQGAGAGAGAGASAAAAAGAAAGAGAKVEGVQDQEVKAAYARAKEQQQPYVEAGADEAVDPESEHLLVEEKDADADADEDAEDEDAEDAEDAEGVLDVFEAGYEDDIVEEEERAREGGALIQDDDKPSKEAAKQNLLEKASDPEKNLKVHRDRQLDSAHEVAAHHIA